MAVLSAAIVFVSWRAARPEAPVFSERPAGVDMREWALYNYAEDAMSAAERYGVPFEYIMALIVLECDGNKPSGDRFESKVYSRLKAVAEGRGKYGSITKEDLVGEDLKELATSHGPLQLMGYHSIQLGVCASDLAGDSGVYLAAEWISSSVKYMSLIMSDRFTDAFHMHNTGRVKPKKGTLTHDPNYCKNGIALLRWFREHREVTHPVLTGIQLEANK